MLWCNRGWGDTGDHSQFSHFLPASWQLNNIIYFVVYCLIVRNIPQYIETKKKHLNVLQLHCRYCQVSDGHLDDAIAVDELIEEAVYTFVFQSSPVTENIQRLQIASSDSLCRVAIMTPWGWFRLTCFYFTLGVVVVPAPVSYDSLVYSQQLSEQRLLDGM